jgi:hypothetical protein
MRGFAMLAGLVLAVSTFPSDIPNIQAQAPPAAAVESRAAELPPPTFPGAIRIPGEEPKRPAEAPPGTRPAPVATAASAAATDEEVVSARVPVAASAVEVASASAPAAARRGGAASAGFSYRDHAQVRLAADIEALEQFRPSYPFWQHIFTIPDGQVAFGSRTDGRLLVSFPSRGDWRRNGDWADASLADALSGRSLPRRIRDRRRAVEETLERLVGPVVHNATRGRFVAPHAARYGAFLSDWSAIYERFGVPAEIGLAQAMVESGFNGRARSSARALGFCQWLPRNWNYMKRRSPHVIEGYNQTTQAGYCAAYLSVLATMYGSFIPALSEHHAGGANVMRTVINGERLGASNTREQYLRGSDFVRKLRDISIRRYRALFRTYGPRSALYAEMIFGNMVNIRRLIEEQPQSKVFAMRVPRNTSITRVMQRTGLSRDQVRRYNPALVRQVPARANLYLPEYVEEFGPDVSFWHRPASPEYAALLDEFLQLEPGIERWHSPAFRERLQEFRRRFSETDTEEGAIIATILAFTIQDLRTSGRAGILNEFRSSDRVRRLFDQGRRELSGLAAQ